MSTAHINIGSNKGDRRSLIDRAVALIVDSEWAGDVRRSSPVESMPWGYDSDRQYINVGVMLTTALDPPELLERLQQIERAVSPAPHRDPSGGYIDREIDIDLIAVDSLTVDTPRLTLPHPRMHLRAFVLAPLAELDPAWTHPLLHKTAAGLLDDCDKNDTKK